MHKYYHGGRTYQSEIDVHFSQLTVAQTLSFAAQADSSSLHAPGLVRDDLATKKRDHYISTLGLKNTIGTKVGGSLVPGISGGERRRTSLAEALICDNSLQCWDNSTKGLDSASALQFIRALQHKATISGSVAIVALYQLSQEIYDTFDKVLLLHEGRQIYFGDTKSAKSFFTDLGFCPSERDSTSDFLYSLTSSQPREIEQKHRLNLPRTVEDFERIWKKSPERAELLRQIDTYGSAFPLKGGTGQDSEGKRNLDDCQNAFSLQVRLCIIRCCQRLHNDLAPPVSAIIGNAIISIILGSMFYNMPDDTSSFFGRGVLLFFTILTNTFLAAFEGVQLWEQRPVVEKHSAYALYRPSAEAVASMICDLPNKVLLSASFNIPFYFLANMRRSPSAFFVFYLFAFTSLLTGSMLYRLIGALSRSLTSSIAPGAGFILILVIYTGFVLPLPSMHPWFRWFSYIDPIGYAFESLMINEFADRQFPCHTYVPQGSAYENATSRQKMCAITGAESMATIVDGTAYISTTFQYHPKHLWRNLGILSALTFVLCAFYLLATETISSHSAKGETLYFRGDKEIKDNTTTDEETPSCPRYGDDGSKSIQLESQPKKELSHQNHSAATFLWEQIGYKIPVEGESKCLLDDVEGWLAPGTLTALYGASGAGKTTLLDVLASRTTKGLVHGLKYINPNYDNAGFARRIGYVQQQDVSLSTMSVSEALEFSARLRQSKDIPDSEKLEYVDEVIDTLDLTEFRNAIIGTPGEGLSIEQRKRVTIGIELAARPELLLFLDEPTSGLNCDSALSICNLLRKLAHNGHAILCTIHQPSGTLFEMFDRLLFLKNGQSIYFGAIGDHCEALITYFSGQGAQACKENENPAEWLLNITSSSSATAGTDWHQLWQSSQHRRKVRAELDTMKKQLSRLAVEVEDKSSTRLYASPFLYQLYYVTKRNLKNDWRMPAYLYSKLFLTIGAVSHAPDNSWPD